MINTHNVVFLLLVCCIQIGLSSVDQKTDPVNCDLKTWYMDALAEGLLDDDDDDADESKAEVRAEVLRLVRRKKGLVYVSCAQLEHYDRTLRQTEPVQSAEEPTQIDLDPQPDSTDIDVDYDSSVPHSESKKLLDDETTTENEEEASGTDQKEREKSTDDGVGLTEQREQNVEEGNTGDSEGETTETISDDFHEDNVQVVIDNGREIEGNKEASVSPNDPAEGKTSLESHATVSFPTSEPSENNRSVAEDGNATSSVRSHESENDTTSNEYLRRVDFYESLQFVKESKSGYCILTRANECWITPRQFLREQETTQSLLNESLKKNEVDTIQNDIDAKSISENAVDTLLSVENFEGSEEIYVQGAEKNEDNNSEESDASDVYEQEEDKEKEFVQNGQNSNEHELHRSEKTVEKTNRNSPTGNKKQTDATIAEVEEEVVVEGFEEGQIDKFNDMIENTQNNKPRKVSDTQKDHANNAKDSETVNVKRNHSHNTKNGVNSHEDSTTQVKNTQKDAIKKNVNTNNDISKKSKSFSKKAVDSAGTTQKTRPQKAEDVQKDVEKYSKSTKKDNVTNKKPIPMSSDEYVLNREKGNLKKAGNAQEDNDKNIENTQEGSAKNDENNEEENFKSIKKTEEENAKTVENTLDGVQTAENTIKVKSASLHKSNEAGVVENEEDINRDQAIRAKKLEQDSADISEHKSVAEDVEISGKITSEAVDSINETPPEAEDSISETTPEATDSIIETSPVTVDSKSKKTPKSADYKSETTPKSVNSIVEKIPEAVEFKSETTPEAEDSKNETSDAVDSKTEIPSDGADVVSRKTSEAADAKSGTLTKGVDLTGAAPSEGVKANSETTPRGTAFKNAIRVEEVDAKRVPDFKEIDAHRETASKEEGASSGTVDADANRGETSDELEAHLEAMPEAANADSESAGTDFDKAEGLSTNRPNDRLSEWPDSYTDSKQEVASGLESEQITTADSSDRTAAASSHDAFKTEDKREIHNKLLNEWFVSVEQRYSEKIQSLELQISRMENHLLQESFNVESKNSAIDQLENHILRLENEILRFNQTFRDLQSEHERLLQSQKTQIQEIGSYREVAEPSSSKKKMDSGSSCFTAVEEQQNKIKHLSEMIQKQTSLFEKLQERFHQVEGDNHHLVKQILNQSVLLNKVLMRMDAMTQEQHWHKNKLETVQQSCEKNSRSHHTKTYYGESQTQREDKLDILMGRKRSAAERVRNREDAERPQIPQMADTQEANDVTTNLYENDFELQASEPTLFPFLAREEDQSSSQMTSMNVDYPEAFPSEEISAQTGEDSADLKYKATDQAQYKIENIRKDEIQEAFDELLERNGDENKLENVEDIKLVDDNFVLSTAENLNEVKEQNEESDDFKDTSKEFHKSKSHDSIKESENREIKGKLKQAEARDKPHKAEEEQSDKPEIDKQLPAEKDPIKSLLRPNSKSSHPKPSKESIGREEPSKKSESPKSENINPKQTKPNITSNANVTASKSPPAAKEAKTSAKEPSKDKGKPAKSSTKSQEPVLTAFPDPPIYKGKNRGDFKDCYDHYVKGRRHNTPLKVSPGPENKAIEVYCDMKNGGWTVIQRRQDGSVDFYRNWNEYKNGFGSVYSEHWIGNDIIHLLTNQDHYSLRVELTDWDRNTQLVDYDRFRISNESDGFRIFVAGYQDSPAGDSLTKHHGNRFSTRDVDNDLVEKEFDGSCARRFSGAWWYYKCYKSNLNGKYYRGGSVDDDRFDGVAWKSWTGSKYSLKKVEMKIRPRAASKS